MNASIGQTGAAISGVDATERTQALADSRRRASENALARAEAAETRRAASRESIRAILEQAVGANTRLSITRNDTALTFVYRAIDTNTGEVVREWPPAEFAKFMEETAAKLGIELSAGALLDEQGQGVLTLSYFAFSRRKPGSRNV